MYKGQVVYFPQWEWGADLHSKNKESEGFQGSFYIRFGIVEDFNRNSNTYTVISGGKTYNLSSVYSDESEARKRLGEVVMGKDAFERLREEERENLENRSLINYSVFMYQIVELLKLLFAPLFFIRKIITKIFSVKIHFTK